MVFMLFCGIDIFHFSVVIFIISPSRWCSLNHGYKIFLLVKTEMPEQTDPKIQWFKEQRHLFLSHKTVQR